jgi:hypothetical protein
MKDATTNAELRELIAKYRLTRPQVRDATMSATTATVDRWLVPPRKGRKANPTYRRMPPSKLALLKVKLASASDARDNTGC